MVCASCQISFPRLASFPYSKEVQNSLLPYGEVSFPCSVYKVSFESLSHLACLWLVLESYSYSMHFRQLIETVCEPHQ
jgi:hypothetical protein